MSDALATAAVIGLLEGHMALRAITVAVLAPVALAFVGAESPSWRRDLTFSARASRLIFASIASLWLGTAAASLVHPAGSLTGLLVATIGLPVVWTLRRTAMEVWIKPAPVRTLLVGSTQSVAEFIAASGDDRDGLKLIGYMDDSSPAHQTPEAHRLGGLSDLADLLWNEQVDRVVMVGVQHLPAADVREATRACDVADVEVELALRELAGCSEKASVTFQNGVPLLRVRKRPARPWEHAIKRSLDVLASAVALIVLSPILLTVSLFALVAQGRPLLFRQTRVGRHGHEFRIVKFRTMTNDAEDRTRSYAYGVEVGSHSIADAVTGLKAAAQNHVTPLGALLRKTSLDELPQLWNVLRGEMSLVGPRPLRRFEHEMLTTSVRAQRSRIRPGITGLWQVRGRSDVAWDERINLDYAHVRNWTLAGDIEILLETMPAMVKGR
jgi:exopolysaccharide biosynthesis polyprenyl glycosylphosphotransferase